MRCPVLILFIACITSQLGCAFHYYDDKTGTEHLWGFGHMKMKVSPAQEGLQASIHGVKILGGGISKTPEDFSLIAGSFRKSQIDVISEDTMLRLEWPSNDFFDVRVGKSPPFELDSKDK